MDLDNRNYTRSPLLPHLGQPVRAVGWLQSWKPVTKDKNTIAILFTDVFLAIGLSGTIIKIDHVWIYADRKNFNKSIGLSKDKVRRLDQSTFNGRLAEYTRSDGSIDIGIRADRSLVELSKFCLVSKSMIIAGRWQSLIDLADSDKILVDNALVAPEQSQRAKKTIQDVRDFAVLNLNKIQESRAKCGAKPVNLSFAALLNQHKKNAGSLVAPSL